VAPKQPTADAAVDRDTIVAIATPPGRGGVGIVRISGSRAATILNAICGRQLPVGRATLASFRDAGGERVDQGLVLRFEAPHSFTGEDVVELHGHGGPVVLDLLVGAALASGARLARPGEFTERAFNNGKLDLAQAEAVADLIASGSAAAVRSAMRSLTGEFSRLIDELSREVLDLRVFVEAAIDFAEEEVDFLSDSDASRRLERLVGILDTIRERATQGAILNEGIALVLAGRPNVGKSSLLNRLLGYERAIVTDVPGTTRDVLTERMDMGGIPVRVVDTAGLRHAQDDIEREGISRALAQIAVADVVLLVYDASQPEPIDDLIAEFDIPTDRLVVAANKSDLLEAQGGATEIGHLAVSALTGWGVESLIGELQRAVGYQPQEGAISARRRHLDALERTRRALERGRLNFSAGAGELLAEDLRDAHQCLGEIVGAVTSDELLGEIFSRFCIGK
jgi:tRNA modification GTPase